ncbi:hypothetical protein HD554DRAFT_2265296 [Boletus coccyginus]|nr:hypothetical protein HD554DRAFT_2265296 [Boletus coccyginus]
MARQLAGMRWDHEKQRYFPLVSRQAPTRRQPDPTRIPAVPAPVAIQRHRGLCTAYRALADLRSVCPHRSQRCPHPVRRTPRATPVQLTVSSQVQSSQIALTDKVARSIVPLQGLVSAFQAVPHSGHVWSFVGDTLGGFYSYMHDEEMESIGGWQAPIPPLFRGASMFDSQTCTTWASATSFGPDCRILYVPLDSPNEGIHVSRIDSRIVHDVWTTDLRGSRLVLGANKQAVMIEDIAICSSLQRLPTQSDVFALAQHENVIYTGLRNGGILRFDARVQRSNSHPLFNSISQRTSSITGLKHLRDHQLLVSFLDGGISTFDLRFPIRTPSITFTGNVNLYTNKLPLVTDPHEKFLFAAGQDNRIRLWSLTTGGPPLDSGGTSSTNQSVFACPFEHRVAALQVVEEREGMCLWAASGTELCKYSLGHWSGIGI